MPVQISDEDLSAALPELTGTVSLRGLDEPVEVFRDAWGIPHIRARNEKDLFAVQGFVTAQDRMWQMDFDRHQALGRWSEWAGSQGLEQDRLLRAAGMGRTARQDYQSASPAARAMADAYAEGVNAFLRSTAAFPIEYKILDQTPEPWENWHCLAVYKMRNTLLGSFEPKLFRTHLIRSIGPRKTARLLRGSVPGELITVPPGAAFDGPPLGFLDELESAAGRLAGLDAFGAGSNAWAVSGRFTRSGLPLVAGDSHRGLDVPNVYYQVHLSCPDFTIIGYSIPGMPGALHFCHNDHVAWGMTYGKFDTQDLFIEQFRDVPGGREYQFNGGWRPAEVLNETILVRGAEPVRVEVTITHHGPVVAGDPATGLALAISDPGLIAATPWLDAVRDAMRSRSVHELDDAFRNWTDRDNNYAVADVRGNFGYLHAGKVPLRPEANGLCAVPGWSGDHEWEGNIPHDELPRAINPESGYAVTCNQRVTGHDYPYFVGFFFSPDHRARRVRARILELEPASATVEDMSRIHADRISIPAQVLSRALLGITPPDDRCADALRLLEQWDGAMDRDLVQPSIYAQTRAALTRCVLKHLLGDAAGAPAWEVGGGEAHIRMLETELVAAIERGDCALLPPGHDWAGVLAASLKRAVDELAAALGNDISAWQWGRLHRTRPHHPLSAVFPEISNKLDPPPLPIHGDGDTPLAGSFVFSEPFTATGVSVNRYIHDPSDWTNSRWIVPLGASGHPASPHYADQAVSWSNVQTIAQIWDWEQIASEAESIQVFEPA